jgi:hypothetical protein
MGACSSRTEDELRQLQQQHLILLNQLTSNLANNSSSCNNVNNNNNNQHAQGTFHFPYHACQHCQQQLQQLQQTLLNNATAVTANTTENTVSPPHAAATGNNSVNLKTHDSIVFKIIAMDESASAAAATAADNLTIPAHTSRHQKKFMIQIDKGAVADNNEVATAVTPVSPTTSISTPTFIPSDEPVVPKPTRKSMQQHQRIKSPPKIEYNNDNNSDEKDHHFVSYTSPRTAHRELRINTGFIEPKSASATANSSLTGQVPHTMMPKRKILKRKKSSLNIDELLSKQNVYDSYFNNIDVYNNDQHYTRPFPAKIMPPASLQLPLSSSVKSKPSHKHYVIENDKFIIAEKPAMRKALSTKPTTFKAGPDHPRPKSAVTVPNSRHSSGGHFWSHGSKCAPLEEYYRDELEALSEESNELDENAAREYEYDYELINDEFEDKTLFAYTKPSGGEVSRKGDLKQLARGKGLAIKPPTGDGKNRSFELAIGMDKMSLAVDNSRLSNVAAMRSALAADNPLSSSLSSLDMAATCNNNKTVTNNLNISCDSTGGDRGKATRFSKSLNIIIDDDDINRFQQESLGLC